MKHHNLLRKETSCRCLRWGRLHCIIIQINMDKKEKSLLLFVKPTSMRHNQFISKNNSSPSTSHLIFIFSPIFPLTMPCTLASTETNINDCTTPIFQELFSLNSVWSSNCYASIANCLYPSHFKSYPVHRNLHTAIFLINEMFYKIMMMFSYQERLLTISNELVSELRSIYCNSIFASNINPEWYCVVKQSFRKS